MMTEANEAAVWNASNEASVSMLKAFADAADATGQVGDGDVLRKAADGLDNLRAPTITQVSQDVEPAAVIDDDIAASVLAIGRAEWGQTPAHDADEHADHIRNSVNMTAEHFGQTEPQHMHGLYVEGTGTVICHTGTSPNSPQHARALTGAWNWLVGQCEAQASSPHAVSQDVPAPAAGVREAALDEYRKAWNAVAEDNNRMREALTDLLPDRLCGEGWDLPEAEKVPIVVTFGALKRARAALKPTGAA